MALKLKLSYLEAKAVEMQTELDQSQIESEEEGGRDHSAQTQQNQAT